MQALTNAGPDCDPCDGPPKVIVHSKRGTSVLVYARKIRRTVEMARFKSFFNLLLIKQSVKRII